MPRYNPAVIEPKWQAYWAEHKTFAVSADACARQAVRAGHVSLSQWRWAARGASRGLHRHRHHLPHAADAGSKRDAPDGLGRLWPARRAARQEDRHAAAGDHRKEHRHVSPPAQDAGLQLRLGPRAGHDRSRILPLDAVDLSATVRYLVRPRAAARPADRRAAHSARGRGRRQRSRAPLSGRIPPGVSVRSAGELVPGAGHRAGQRRSDRRGERARRPSGGAAAAAAMDAAHHGLCRPAGKGSRHGRLVRQHQGAAAQLDRPLDRRGSRFLYRSALDDRRQTIRRRTSKPGATCGPFPAFRGMPATT